MKTYLEKAKEAMEGVVHPMHVVEDGLPKRTPLGEERQKQACIRTAIEASKTLALLSIAESLESLNVLTGEMQLLRDDIRNLDQNLYSAIVKR